jgi:hypothetical protein
MSRDTAIATRQSGNDSAPRDVPGETAPVELADWYREELEQEAREM